MWNAFVWISDLVALALILFLAGIMISIWMGNSQIANFTNQRSLSHFQKFVSSIYERLTLLENLCLITLCLDLILNLTCMYAVFILGLVLALLFCARYLSGTRQRPIHKQVMKWDADYIPGKWEYLRDYCDTAHQYMHCILRLAPKKTLKKQGSATKRLIIPDQVYSSIYFAEVLYTHCISPFRSPHFCHVGWFSGTGDGW